jgi:hypothetical protein
MIRRLLTAGLLFFATAVTGLFALDLTQGNMKVALSRDTGRFSVSYKPAGGAWTPLFYAQDPRTTVLEVLDGGRLYRMGDSRQFKQTVKKTSTGAEISWTSQDLSVTESFTFMTSTGTAQADGVLISIRMTNNSEAPSTVGARYLIDTYLGEQNRIEFVTPTLASMTNETEFTGSQIPSYWVSPEDRKMSVALEAVMKGSGVTTPNRVIFANWKRLNDSRWNFASNPNRNFNLLPYSINDSAVVMYYDPEVLPAGESKTITMLLGQYSRAGWGGPTFPSPAARPASTESNAAEARLADQSSGVSKISGQPAESPHGASLPAADTTMLVEDNLKAVDKVLKEIQKMLDSPRSASQSDVRGLRQVLDKLNADKTRAGLQ